MIWEIHALEIPFTCANSPIRNDVEMGKVGLLNRYTKHLTGQRFVTHVKQLR